MNEPAPTSASRPYRVRRFVKRAAVVAALFVVGLWLYANAVFRSRIGDTDIRPEPALSLAAEFGTANGWSGATLAQARGYARNAGFTSVVVLHDGKLVAEWGRPSACRTSIRCGSRS
jgi:hypothetical protein